MGSEPGMDAGIAPHEPEKVLPTSSQRAHAIRGFLPTYNFRASPPRGPSPNRLCGAAARFDDDFTAALGAL